MKQNRDTASKKRTIYIVTEQTRNLHEGGEASRIGVFGSEAKAIRAFCETANFTIRTEAQDAAREAIRDDPLMKRFSHPFAKSEIGKANEWRNPWFTAYTSKMATSAMSIRYAPKNQEAFSNRLYATVDIDVRCPAVKATAVRQALDHQREENGFNQGESWMAHWVSLFFAYDNNDERGVMIEQVVVE